MQRDQAESLAHPELAHHLSRDARGLFDVLLGAGGDVAENNLLSGAPAHRGGHAGVELGLRRQVAVLERQLDRDAQSLPTRDHRHFVHGIALGDRLHHQGVADLVIGDDRLLFRRDHPATLFRPSHHAKAGLLQLESADRHFLVARRQDGGLVQEIGEVGARETGRLPRHDVEVDVLGERLVRGVEAQDGAPAVEVGRVDGDPPVEAAGAE